MAGSLLPSHGDLLRLHCHSHCVFVLRLSKNTKERLYSDLVDYFLEEDEKLKSKELLDSEWIDFQHNIPDPPQAPKRKQSLLKGPDDEYDGSSTGSSRMTSTSRAVPTSGIIQRRTSPTTNITGVRQMNIIQEDKEEVHFRKEK